MSGRKDDRVGFSRRSLFPTGWGGSGEDNPNSKLTEDKVRAIRDNPDELTGLQLAERYGVSDAQVSAIRTGKAWRHVK